MREKQTNAKNKSKIIFYLSHIFQCKQYELSALTLKGRCSVKMCWTRASYIDHSTHCQPLFPTLNIRSAKTRRERQAAPAQASVTASSTPIVRSSYLLTYSRASLMWTGEKLIKKHTTKIRGDLVFMCHIYYSRSD